MKGNEIVERFNALKSNRSTLDTVLQQIEEVVVPYRGEFYKDMSNEASVNWKRTGLYDNTAGISCNLLASQMHGNLTSPVTKWFGLTFRDPDTKDDHAAVEWLEDAESKVWQTLQESNFDTAAPEMYLDIGGFGTSIVTMEDIDDLTWKGVNFNTMPVMDTYFESDQDGMPFRIYRHLRYTLLELDDTFDLPKSMRPKNRENTSVDQTEDVIFVIYKEPENSEYQGKPMAPTLRPVQWRYVHKETGKILKKKGSKIAAGGYYDFPGMTIRWQKTAGSRWGYSPAMIMLADIRQLNTMQYMIDEAWAKAIDPPMMAEDTAVVGDLDNVPGGLTIVSTMDALKPLYPASAFNVGYEGIDRKQESIRAGFFVDKLELKDSPQMTAYEVQVRYERMLRLLAPTLGRLKTDFLMPVVQGIFNRLLRMGQLDDLPESMVDAELDIEFTGPLPRALKGEIADGMERWLLGMSQQLEINPESIDIVDFDQYNRTLAEQRGVPADSLKTQDEVIAVREERAEQMKAQQEIAQVQAAGEAAKAVGEGGQAVQAAGGQLQAVE